MTLFMRRQTILTLLFLFTMTDLGASQSNAPCALPQYHQFDFWIGDWDAFEVGSPSRPIAHAVISRILNSCVIHEDYQQNDGMKGQSFSIYDSSRDVWHQSWVTNRGRLLVIEGKSDGHAVHLSGADQSNGKPILIRALWEPTHGGVHEKAEKSTDGGKSWSLWFDIEFRPHKVDDKAAIAALDTEYQAAVAKNDLATMARLLADNFTLVTGSGKVYSKQDLLDEAKSGRLQYERQDDSEQTVRLWGNTAVITAKLYSKGTEAGKPFEYTLWFSDTYVRTPSGWRYVFGQSSIPLPKASGK